MRSGCAAAYIPLLLHCGDQDQSTQTENRNWGPSCLILLKRMWTSGKWIPGRRELAATKEYAEAEEKILPWGGPPRKPLERGWEEQTPEMWRGTVGGSVRRTGELSAPPMGPPASKVKRGSGSQETRPPIVDANVFNGFSAAFLLF